MRANDSLHDNEIRIILPSYGSTIALPVVQNRSTSERDIILYYTDTAIDRCINVLLL